MHEPPGKGGKEFFLSLVKEGDGGAEQLMSERLPLCRVLPGLPPCQG